MNYKVISFAHSAAFQKKAPSARDVSADAFTALTTGTVRTLFRGDQMSVIAKLYSTIHSEDTLAELRSEMIACSKDGRHKEARVIAAKVNIIESVLKGDSVDVGELEPDELVELIGDAYSQISDLRSKIAGLVSQLGEITPKLVGLDKANKVLGKSRKVRIPGSKERLAALSGVAKEFDIEFTLDGIKDSIKELSGFDALAPDLKAVVGTHILDGKYVDALLGLIDSLVELSRELKGRLSAAEDAAKADAPKADTVSSAIEASVRRAASDEDDDTASVMTGVASVSDVKYAQQAASYRIQIKKLKARIAEYESGVEVDALRAEIAGLKRELSSRDKELTAMAATVARVTSGAGSRRSNGVSTPVVKSSTQVKEELSKSISNSVNFLMTSKDHIPAISFQAVLISYLQSQDRPVPATEATALLSPAARLAGIKTPKKAAASVSGASKGSKDGSFAILVLGAFVDKLESLRITLPFKVEDVKGALR